MAYQTQIIEATGENSDFRRVLFTSPLSQLVVMSIEPGGEIGMETHDLDQILVFVSGSGKSVLNGKEAKVGPGTVTVVPAGTEHNFVNDGDDPLKLYTVYTPPEHPDGTVHRTKAEADAAEARAHGHHPQTAGFTVGTLRSREGR